MKHQTDHKQSHTTDLHIEPVSKAKFSAAPNHLLCNATLGRSALASSGVTEVPLRNPLISRNKAFPPPAPRTPTHSTSMPSYPSLPFPQAAARPKLQFSPQLNDPSHSVVHSFLSVQFGLAPSLSRARHPFHQAPTISTIMIVDHFARFHPLTPSIARDGDKAGEGEGVYPARG